MATMYSATRPLMLLTHLSWVGEALASCVSDTANGWRQSSESFGKTAHFILQQSQTAHEDCLLVHMHQPGIEPGSHRWQRCILPLDH